MQCNITSDSGIVVPEVGTTDGRHILTMENGTVKIGGMYARIAGDPRYQDHVWLEYDVPASSVTLYVTETGAVGGMDGPGRTTPPNVVFHKTVVAHPKNVMELLKSVLKNERYAFAKYGKPTKNFGWYGGNMGLSVYACKIALDCAKTSKRMV